MPGIRELVIHGEAGYLVPPGDVRALAGALELLLNNHHLRQTMGQAGQRRIHAEFSLDSMVRRYEEAYLTLVESGCRTHASALQA